jgi:hypothetical protein
MGGVRRLIETLLHRLPQGPEDPTLAPVPPPGAATAAVAGIPPPGAAGTASDVVPYHRILPSPLVWQASSPGASQQPSRDVRTGRHLKHSADSNPYAAIPMSFGASRSIEAKNTATADATDCPLTGPGPKLVSALQVLLQASAPHKGLPALQVQNSSCAFCGGSCLFFLRHLRVTVSAASRALHASACSFQSTARFHTYLALACFLRLPPLAAGYLYLWRLAAPDERELRREGRVVGCASAAPGGRGRVGCSSRQRKRWWRRWQHRWRHWLRRQRLRQRWQLW